jgi:hypothetical protein
LNYIKTFELQYNAVFAAVDISILKIEAGWVYGSIYLVDLKKERSPSSGFFLSIQGMIPVFKR